MSKKHAHSLWSKIQPFSPWTFLVLGLISGVICLYAMRQNNLHMVELRDQVFVADKANGDVETALRELRSYIYAHMNTNLSSGNNIKPPIQLKYRYDRLVAAEKKRISKENVNIYDNAQNFCAQSSAKITCVLKYIKSHGQKEQPIPDSLYKFDFISPAWTPDLAGISLVLTIVFGLLFGVRYGLELWVKHDLQ